MNTVARGILLAVATYVVTMGMSILIAILAIIALMMASLNCSAMGAALIVLWVVIAVVCIVSVFVYVVLARKYAHGCPRLNVITAAYAATLLVSYLVIAFGLMVLFNC